MAYSSNSSQRGGNRIRYDIIERIGVLGERRDGWTREVNIVAWNGAQAKVDIRDWDPEHKRMSKGITLLEDEAENLVRALSVRYGFRIGNNTMASAVYEHRNAAVEPKPAMPEPEERRPPESFTESSQEGVYGNGNLYDSRDEGESFRSAEVAEDSRSDDADDDDYD